MADIEQQGSAMSTDLTASVQEYLGLRHAMGYRLRGHQSLLYSFVDYLNAQGSHHITVADALAWACLPKASARRWHAARLAVCRSRFRRSRPRS